MASFTRGFLGRSHGERDPRLPPGQYDAKDDWPVLNAEVTPTLATETWTFSVEGLVERPTTWTWDEIHALPPSTYDGAIHCVTTWSKFDMTFTGVSVDTLLEAAGPLGSATHVLALCHTGYTTNLPLDDVTDGKAWVAWEVDGGPLPVEHGGPARCGAGRDRARRKVLALAVSTRMSVTLALCHGDGLAGAEAGDGSW
ncbi:MAG: molybdopterin-dependent oxidoreductase, partial [Acidimicrobiales bacterium]